MISINNNHWPRDEDKLAPLFVENASTYKIQAFRVKKKDD